MGALTLTVVALGVNESMGAMSVAVGRRGWEAIASEVCSVCWDIAAVIADLIYDPELLSLRYPEKGLLLSQHPTVSLEESHWIHRHPTRRRITM